MGSSATSRRTASTNLPIRRERGAPRTEKLTNTGIGGIGFSDPRSHSSRPWLFCSLALPMGAVSLVSGILSSLEILVPPWRSGSCSVATRTPPHVCALFLARSRPRRCPCDWR
jgi:hypothetical protein